MAKKHKCETVAFPLISSGIYGYPKAEALRRAVDTICTFLFANDISLYTVIFDKSSYKIGEQLFSDIQAFIDDNYADEHTDTARERMMRSESCYLSSSKPAMTLDDALKNIDESFSEMLLRKIDESGMTDSECYKKANIDRKLFSKIRTNRGYRPSKATAIAFAIALSMPLDDTKELLMKAGFALSHSNKSDIIIEYFIDRGNYNIFEINEALFAFDQPLLGA